ncbi:MAG: Deoxycytidine triphosphate deaminase [Synergistetes bacterium ADurb.BinA166]|nr:MAG: Deoxycytidine triphosphate deaminase [Synergistetes bacterium ADurb.BinA166]
MILSDTDLKKRGASIVEPFDPECVQPSSYDVALEGHLAIPKPYSRIDLRTDEPRDRMVFEKFTEFELHPRQAVLACTQEVVRVPHDLSARVEGKSSLGRLFLSVHITAGVLDAGFEGQVTLEIVNHGPWTIVMWPGMKIAQISFFKMTSVCETPYGSGKLGSHYLGQKGPTPAAGRRGPGKPT